MAKPGGAGGERDVALLDGTARAHVSKGETLSDWHARYDRWLSAQIRRRFSSQSGEDITQETWLRMAALDSFDAIRHPKAFLLRVASNLALGQVRRGAVAERFAAVTPTVSHEDADQLETVFFRQMVLDLPQPLRDVFLLSRVGGLTNSQIADQLGISPKTVEWRMTRALARCAAQVRR
ncbi:RNA polymerase sigma-70 factor (ECF subfamily) [Brevundimonas bullata]|uniref:RNA polymerase sigma-70 factor (ECF subfamily) n=1 Tax=Brevundimonas bullata TaxID=13160 RepID=A0A7W7N4S8_9CAUL|nr:RNA polymerase sigma factor [Brevundimonas bullata]MBB4798706.1 RNA polymerase sigma-70 factor (ECF subfamily) [Brevundimonas bullata]MBB6383666.1 RNA polymerase sigma-70 factor (ECF subfamily) [Brevundimonas bullata]